MNHIELLVEEPSTEAALKNLLPEILTKNATYQIHSYNGKQNLLRKLPFRLRGYRRMSVSLKIVVLIDRDQEDCINLKKRLEGIAIDAGFITKSSAAGRNFQVLNRIAIEELEAWFFGDICALVSAYPGVSENLGKKAAYRNPDMIRGGTWEKLEKELQTAGFFKAGISKVSVATEISSYMDISRNCSKSFQVFVSGLRSLVGQNV